MTIQKPRNEIVDGDLVVRCGGFIRRLSDNRILIFDRYFPNMYCVSVFYYGEKIENRKLFFEDLDNIKILKPEEIPNYKPRIDFNSNQNNKKPLSQIIDELSPKETKKDYSKVCEKLLYRKVSEEILDE